MEPFITKRIKTVALVFCTALTIMACKKNDATPILAGNYSGSFNFYDSGFAYWHGVGTATLALTDNAFTASNLTISPVTPSTPVVANGNYKVKGDSITFSNAVISPGNGQNSTLTLTGKYQYHFEGDSLIITRSYSVGDLSTFSQYRLKRN